MRRSKQSLSHYHNLTLDMGQNVPIGIVPVLPGDTIGHSTNLFLRASPMLAPVMHQVDARVNHFYVANRTIWDGWEDFITGGEDGMDTSVVPTITTTGVKKDLLDYMGIPTVAGVDINALPLYAINFIHNEFFRDQDLQTERELNDTTVPNVCWEKDYASTARPWSQKGPSVSIPVGGSAPVSVAGPSSGQPGADLGIKYSDQDATMYAASNQLRADNATPDSDYMMFADLANATGADPIAVRQAWGLQRFMEEAARYGSRYPEKMRRLGSRYKGLLERPEYLGGGRQAMAFSEVLQTANDASDRTYGVGDLYGHGIAAARTNKYARRIDEHGYIISMLSIRPSAVYQDGVHREYLKSDREDFHDPFLEDIGMQPVYNGELDLGHTSGHKEIFGYSDRYDEYRGHPSCVSSEFRDTLDYWHLARKLTDPVLNSDFVTCVPSKRIFAEQTQNSIWCMAHHKIAVHRNISQTARTRLL